MNANASAKSFQTVFVPMFGIMACLFGSMLFLTGLGMLIYGLWCYKQADQLTGLQEMSVSAAQQCDGQQVAVRARVAHNQTLPSLANGMQLVYYREVDSERYRDRDGRWQERTYVRDERKALEVILAEDRNLPMETVTERDTLTIRVDPAAASFRDLVRISGGHKSRVEGIYADRLVTVIGTLNGGVINSGSPFIITPVALVEAVKTQRFEGKFVFWLGGGLLLVGTAGLAVAFICYRRWRAALAQADGAS